jgi:quercetin dioxygenase-like cupin family protein
VGDDRIMSDYVARPADYAVDEQDWGRLVWMVSGALGNSKVLTVGRCYIKPGRSNPAHYHPNSDEVLHVVRGHIEHRVGDEWVEMNAGDTISVTLGVIHQARNIGPDESEFLITFNTADRQVIGE